MKPRSLQIFHHKLLYHISAISSNPTRSSYQPQISHSAHWIWLGEPFLCVMGLWIAFLTMIYAQIALKFPLLFKLHHFTFLPTHKSTRENISFSSLLNEATKSQTGVLRLHTWRAYCILVSVKSFVNSLHNLICVSVQCGSRSINLTPSQSG